MNAGPIIPWIGGKRRLAAHILPLLPEHQCYVEVFAGAAAIFFAKAPAPVEVLNDMNGDLVNLYRVVKHHLEEFVKQFRWALVSRELFKWAQATPPETMTDIQRAARFYYLQRLCFGGKIEGRTFGTTTSSKPKINLLRIEEDLSEVHLRLAQVTIERLDWQQCVAKYDRPHTLFFMDPPYFGTEGYGMTFGLEQYERMAELLRGLQGRAVVTVNDIPEMRRAFAGMAAKRVSIRYRVAGQHRAKKVTGELIITSWKDRP